jgi:uncharacterized protein (DUF488 family)
MITSNKKIIYTIGHSTHPIDEFIDILKAYHIGLLVDIRSYPGSRHAPQYNSDKLAKSLKLHNIEYIQLPSLGGLRPTKKDSINIGWENKSFRGYADYMQTPEFTKGINELIELRNNESQNNVLNSKNTAVVIMCAEAVPWRCHRSLVGDALLVRGFTVIDILSKTYSKPHKLTPWAIVDGTKIIYPANYKG